MRGRVQAGAAALLGTLVPIITPAVIALVTLRKGAVEGTLILFIGLLPTLLTFGGNGSQPLVFVSFISSVLILVVVYLSALVLRQTASWSSTMMTLLMLSVMALLLVKQLTPMSLSNVINSFTEAMTEQVGTATIDKHSIGINEFSLTGALASYIMFIGLCSLFLGRWWQSLLYNPGGFGSDFHQFRLGSTATIICLMVSLYFVFQGDAYLTWSFVFALPLIMVTIAIVHAVAKASKNAKQWLVVFYVTMTVLSILQLINQLINYVQIILMSIGFLDNWLDFRKRKSQFT